MPSIDVFTMDTNTMLLPLSVDPVGDTYLRRDRFHLTTRANDVVANAALAVITVPER